MIQNTHLNSLLFVDDITYCFNQMMTTQVNEEEQDHLYFHLSFSKIDRIKLLPIPCRLFTSESKIFDSAMLIEIVDDKFRDDGINTAGLVPLSFGLVPP